MIDGGLPLAVACGIEQAISILELCLGVIGPVLVESCEPGEFVQ